MAASKSVWVYRQVGRQYKYMYLHMLPKKGEHNQDNLPTHRWRCRAQEGGRKQEAAQKSVTGEVAAAATAEHKRKAKGLHRWTPQTSKPRS